MEHHEEQLRPAAGLAKSEVLVLAVALVGAHHAIPLCLLWVVLPGQAIYDRWGADAYANVHDALTAVVPLLLCLATTSRSGLRLGTWRSQTLRIGIVCLVPAVLTAIVYPFTSQPFTGGAVGGWLISPAAQDLMFAGYLYGLLSRAFPGQAVSRIPIGTAALLAAALFSLWHAPNLLYVGTAYVVFQLVYTFLFYSWMLLARQWTGSILPVIAAHMASNFVAWRGW